ncbi:hypothetical protein A1O1_00861 [Capronia coronata CBS 617.96]|uniref:Isopenicillin N synthase-like Fe(2+) 2OG dioxygenase domain-containing protein n=1 Tax=Capronia coronata CBS 617.96 TaxID=1182541 RepID=W9YS51_9EURO|nr:uncharacterized protein A1O1_00861 [Capronia coronata CBS 617.96]EXJ95737.1 hypothetical protein A1O1_00861 [Capronia coronata CBS 617.96]
MVSKIIHASPATVSLHDLQTNTVPFSTLVAAFGPDSLGILVVKDLPSEFARLRTKVLSDASRLAALPEEKLQQLTNPTAKYLVGWSHGVETLRPGVVDTAKGSYYVNCAFYQDGQHGLRRDEKEKENEKKMANSSSVSNSDSGSDPNSSPTSNSTSSSNPGFKEYTAPNIWPSETDIPGFQTDTQALITLIIDTAVLVARACDRFAAAQQIPGYEEGYLERVVRGSTTTKARLLHYFPMEAQYEPQSESESESEPDGKSEFESEPQPSPPAGEDNDDSDSDNNDKEIADTWCTTHLDHGCLTGLTSAMFVDEACTAGSQQEMIPERKEEKQKDSSDVNGRPVQETINSYPGPELPSSPDPSSGLYILSRTGQICKVSIPRDSLAFQTGEALELITKGKFKAVPHFVKGVDVKNVDNYNYNDDSDSDRRDKGGLLRSNNTTKSKSKYKYKPKIARNTLAVFTQPNLNELVDAETGLTFGEFARGVVKRNTAG